GHEPLIFGPADRLADEVEIVLAHGDPLPAFLLAKYFFRQALHSGLISAIYGPLGGPDEPVPPDPHSSGTTSLTKPQAAASRVGAFFVVLRGPDCGRRQESWRDRPVQV